MFLVKLEENITLKQVKLKGLLKITNFITEKFKMVKNKVIDKNYLSKEQVAAMLKKYQFNQ